MTTETFCRWLYEYFQFVGKDASLSVIEEKINLVFKDVPKVEIEAVRGHKLYLLDRYNE